MNNNQRDKEFTFLKSESNCDLSQEQIKTLFEKFEISKEVEDIKEIKSGCLLIEVFSNNMDSNLDYDVTLRIGTDIEDKNYTLRTSSDLNHINQSYMDILNSIN